MKKIFLLLILSAASLCSTLFAQSYKIESLGNIVSNSENVIDVSPNGYILLSDNSKKTACPVVYNLHTKEKIKLCEKGLVGASAINSRGDVAGWILKGGKKKAAYWLKKGGIKQIKSEFAEGVAYDINNNQEVVGIFSEPIETCYNDETDNYCYKEYKSKAFRHSSKNKYKLIRENSYFSFAFGIQDDGDVYIIENKEKDGRIELGFENKKGEFKNLPDLRTSPFDSYLTGEYYRSARVNNRGQVLFIAGNLITIYSPNSGWRDVSGATSCERCDYQELLALSENGLSAIRSGSVSFLSSYPKPAIPITCLVPQNRIVSNTKNLRVSDMNEISGLGGFLSDGTLIFSADITGDNKDEQLFQISPLNKSERGTEYDFCPVISLDSDSKECSTEEKQEICRNSFSINNQLGLYKGDFTLELLAFQNTGYEGEGVSCAPIAIREIKVNGGKGQVEFKIDPLFTYQIKMKSDKYSQSNLYLSIASETNSAICKAPQL